MGCHRGVPQSFAMSFPKTYALTPFPSAWTFQGVAGTGPDGRIVAADVQLLIASGGGAKQVWTCPAFPLVSFGSYLCNGMGFLLSDPSPSLIRSCKDSNPLPVSHYPQTTSKHAHIPDINSPGMYLPTSFPCPFSSPRSFQVLPFSPGFCLDLFEA